MKVHEEERVGEIAARFPAAISVFERYGVDYCCGGRRTLREAAEGKQLAPAVLLEALEAHFQRLDPGEPIAPEQQSLRALIDHLVNKHHVFTRDAIERIERTLRKVMAAHGAQHPELAPIERVATALCAELGPHLMREEQVLFPWIAAAESAREGARPLPQARFGTVRNPVRMMDHEHDSAGEMLATLKELTQDYAVPAWACPTAAALYRTLGELDRDLRTHIHLERNVLFPRAIALETA